MTKISRNGVFVPKAKIDETLGSTFSSGKKLLEPLKTFAKAEGFPLNILENHHVSNEAEVHLHEGDLWCCIEGEVTFTYGGEMKDPWEKKNLDGSTDPREIKADTIVGGTIVAMKPGDWLWIPAGVPHQHRSEETARLLIIKIPKSN